MPEMERNYYDLTHFVHQCGEIGRLQTLMTVPTLPGDSFSVSLDGIIRLAPLRKEVVQESQVDLFAFWVPYRHIYGSAWNTLVQEGIDASYASLPTTTLAAAERNAAFLLQPFAPASLPAWLLRGYNQIWDRYFRVPSLDPLASDDYYPTGATPDADRSRLYGYRCARLRHPTNIGLRTDTANPLQPWRDLDSADYTYSAPISGPNAVIDLRSLEQVKGRYESELETTWFTERYTDLLNRKWGSSVNIDADERPELVWRETFRLGGHDVDGTADANLGQFTGKTVGGFQMNIPRRYFPEHGTLWVMALIRWPTIYDQEIHPLTRVARWTPEYVLGDPDIFQTRPPQYSEGADWNAGGAGTYSDIQEAFGNHYRVHNNFVHRNFQSLPGYPFLGWGAGPAFGTTNWYYAVGDNDDVFQTSQLGHWALHCRAGVEALRYVPDPRTSIFAGAE